MTSTDTGSTRTSARERRRTVRQTFRDVANPATVKGAIAALTGLVVLTLPNASLAVFELIVGGALLVTSSLDLWFGITGRHAGPASDRGHSPSRALAVIRGLAGILVALLVLLTPRDAVPAIVWLLGLYALFRGVVSVTAGVFGRDRSQRPARLTIGIGSIAFGVLAITVPDSVSEGVVLAVAVAAIIAGGILLAYGLRVGAPGSQSTSVVNAPMAEIMWDWVRHTDIGDERREQLADGLYFESPGRSTKLTAWWVMLILSVSIATFAVLQDSTAVVIGAMLIAPLMTPILGLAGAVVNGWRRRAAASSALVAAGAAASIALAYLISRWVPELVSFDANTQITSRVNPTLVDMLIALAAGAAGAFATVNVRVASSIAGVAIAVALVPPLGVVGVALESQRWDDAFGAFVLFMTNFVSIVLAAAGVFILTGLAQGSRLREQRRQIASTLAPFGALALAVMVPLVFTAEGILASASQTKTAQQVVNDWLGEDTRLRVEQVAVEDGTVTVDIAGTEVLPPPRQLQSQLSEELGDPVELVIELTPSVEVTVSEEGTLREEDSEGAG